MPYVLSLSASLLWGSYDFLAHTAVARVGPGASPALFRHAARVERVGTVVRVLAYECVGLTLALLALGVGYAFCGLAGPEFRAWPVVAAGLGGACSVGGILAWARASRRGPVAPIAGVAAGCVLLPTLISVFALGEDGRSVALLLVGAGVVCFSVAWVAVTHEQDDEVDAGSESTSRAAYWVPIGGIFLLFGSGFFFSDQATVPYDGGTNFDWTPLLWFLVINQIVSVMLLVGLHRLTMTGRGPFATEPSTGFRRQDIVCVAPVGAADVLATTAMGFAYQGGNLWLAILAGLAGPVTVLLAYTVAREPWHRGTVVGIVVALLGALLVIAGGAE